ncbi:uncharacterized protein LACBIDRAFT_321771 [Laccaria bicolor S238N-H82]|uniref:Predicted protein n=1 Tax=Laccaria bicolor (strain S238N-H82 / ATCC MYA-4686) TaxID=486041 RepID=B0CU39_LACBS|nr:uncharacterized protein LACBIDRAFT_321771 [Laccaria bicolor S238N-H82]EDR14028.1 predicted protein [Laccaria bicolor S238N-H82]|eukprot:XP_001874587.1 predicted protein [Laccaria bicolor S238N-H82]
MVDLITKTRPDLDLLLVDTEQEIARLRQVAIQTRRSINKSSSISSLPAEILSEIFAFCCQPKYNAIGGVDSQGICPLRLSAVCKAWRALTWTTSALWSVIILVDPKPWTSHLDEILAAWIERARNRPLSIRYKAGCIDLLQRLAQETSTWMNVSIFLGSKYNSATCPEIPSLFWTQFDVVAAQNLLYFARFLEVFNANTLATTHLRVNPQPTTATHYKLRCLVLKAN